MGRLFVSTDLVPRAMMRALTACFLTFLFMSTEVLADTSDPGFYLGFRLLPAMGGVSDETLTGGPGGTEKQTGDDPGPTFGVGGLVGYHWSQVGIPIRTDVEYAYRIRHDFDIEASGPPKTGYKNDLATHSIMLNAYYDIATDTPWRPFVGVGIGWARNNSDTERTNTSNGNIETKETAVDNFAYSFQLGSRVAISPEWIGEIGYRYIDFGEVDSGKFSAGDQITADHYVSHDILLGVSYLF